MRGIKQCWVKLQRLPPNVLSNYESHCDVTIAANVFGRVPAKPNRWAISCAGRKAQAPSNANIVDAVLPAKRNRRAVSCAARKAQAPSNANVVDAVLPAKRNSRAVSCADRKAQAPSNANNVDAFLPAKRNRRTVSCADRKAQAPSNANIVDAVFPAKRNRRLISEKLTNPKSKTGKADAILLPIPAPGKRTKREMSCNDRSVFDDRDEFQENDQNPVFIADLSLRTLRMPLSFANLAETPSLNSLTKSSFKMKCAWQTNFTTMFDCDCHLPLNSCRTNNCEIAIRNKIGS